MPHRDLVQPSVVGEGPLDGNNLKLQGSWARGVGVDVLVPMGVELRESKALLALELPPPVVYEGEEEGVEEAVDQAPAEDEHGAELDHTAYDGAAAGRKWASGRQALGALGAGCVV